MPPAIQPEAPLATGPVAALPPAARDAIEAAAFRKLVAHLRDRTDVQNIDLMNLAGFCRNCLSRWYAEAAADRATPLDVPASREIIYGVPYKDWQAAHQRESTPAQQAAFAATPHALAASPTAPAEPNLPGG